jgi:hypothetical protein
MRFTVTTALGATLALGLSFPVSAASAATRTTGRQSFRGQVIAPAETGARKVVSTIIVAKGVFDGVGRLVEVDNRRGDPDNVNRDDLVFPQGTLHIRSTSQTPQFSLDPQTCAWTVRIKQITKVQGGTRKFRHASGTFKSSVRGWGVAARTPAGTCSEGSSLLEADAVSAHGTLSY